MIKNGPPPTAQNNQWVAVDLEMMGLPENQLHRPKPECFGLATFTINGTAWVCKEPDEVKVALRNTDPGVLVFHNAPFDITHLRSIASVPDRKKVWDTLLIEKILYNGYYSSFGLEDLAARYLDISMDKSGQKAWAKAKDWNDVTEDMIQYAGDDGIITEQIAPLQKAKMDQNDVRVWTRIDRPAMWAVQAFRGFPIDLPKFQALTDHHIKQAEESIKKVSFNPLSWKQVMGHFEDTWHIKLASTDDEHLNELVKELDDPKKHKKVKEEQKDNIRKTVESILEARSYTKNASTYGTSFLDLIEYEQGVPVLHGSYNITGAMTGRMSCDSPNMQNIPARIGPMFRECFIPYPGEVLIVADYSSQEPRITADYSLDPILIQIFLDNLDIYIEMGYMVYGERFDKKDVRRKYMKDMFLGMCYGLSKYGLSEKYGWTLDESESLIKRTFQAFPTAKKYVDKSRKNRTHTLTKGGRKFHLNPYSSQVERHSLNAPIQGTASDQMKMSLASIYERWPVQLCQFGVVAVVHDEMVVSVPKQHAPILVEFIRNEMERTASSLCPSVPFKADVHICETWAEK